ncbi:hypothetical protein B484DRAFT_131996 [Ochromonadaceae sp. CCMP2298]|nr:hypothetical protein B484DRAFT_131996 [Ochromonadaceae sp. CCMP2298]
MAETQSQDGDGDWGWEPLDEEPDHPHPPRGQESPRPTHEAKTSPLSKSNSEKSFPGRKGSNSSLAMKGIVSSPSFAELEMAIGNTLNNSDSSEFNAPSKPFPRSKHSGTDLTQQKLHQQRLRQQQRGYSHGHHSRAHGHGGSPVHNPQPPAREVLEPFTNETEAHAIVLFHSPHASPESIQDACCKHGGLYYLRPEFHLKGVTLLSYLDLRCAASAKACLGGELGTAADASAHFSVMLHAASSPLDETRLKVSGLPGSCSIEEVHSIFTRYGQLRSLVKTTLEGQQPAARTAAMAEGGETSDSGEAGADVGEEAGQAYAVDLEYFNINDARLAASELSAASAQLWDTEVSIEFAPLDERKQHLCRQLLATLSRWRSEMANAAYSSMGGNYGMQGMQGMQHAGMQGMYGMQGMQGMYGMQGMQGMPGMHGQGGWGGMQMGVPIGMGGMQHGMSRSMMGGMPMPLPMLMESPHQLGSQYYEQGRQQEQHEQHQYQQHQQHQQQQEQQEQQQGQQQQESVAVDGIAAAPSRRAEVETLGGAGAGAAAGDGQDSGGYGEDNETAYGTNSSSYSQQRPVGYEGPRDHRCR